jgi:hypothetical protein
MMDLLCRPDRLAKSLIAGFDGAARPLFSTFMKQGERLMRR